MNGQLFIISTPIGNLEDITYRAINIIKSVDYILAEDSRQIDKIFQHYSISNKSTKTFNEINEEQLIPSIIRDLRQGENIGLVSNAGTPLISDPGYKLVKYALNHGIQVVSIPGASALLTGLVSSGLPPDHFVFLSYLPKKIGKKTKLLQETKKLDAKLISTIVFYESPNRILETLKLVSDIFGNDIKIVICRELTKKFEEIVRG